MTTETQHEPVFDPETGEVLAVTPEERAALVQTLVDEVVEAAVSARRARRARLLLDQLLQVGDARVSSTAGWAVTVKPGKAPARSVITHKLEEHAAALRGNAETAALAPREEVREVTVYPGVGDLDKPKVRAALALLGLTPETFLHTPDHHVPATIEVVGPKEEA